MRRASQAASVLSLILSLACAAKEPPTRGGARRPVILVVIDALRQDHLSFYGYPDATSPGLDRLAQESVVFNNCLAPSSWTKPSVVSLMSGLNAVHHGAHRRRGVPGQVELLAEVLHKEDYATAAFSGNPWVSAKFGLSRGFDTFYAGGGDSPKDYPDITVLLDAARAWIAERSREPFFVYLHVMNVHGPYRAPPEYRERFLKGPDEEEFPFQGELWKALSRSGTKERPEPSLGQRADLLARYDGAVAYTDEKLTEFFDELRSTGLLDRSLLVVTSDHGEELLDHGGVGHRKTLYHETVNVPLLLRDGRRDEPRLVETPVGLIDVAATILDLVGVAPANAIFGDGVSLRPLMSGGGRIDRSQPLVSHLREWGGNASLIQQWPLRLLQIQREYSGRRGVVELYDEVADPQEMRDLSGEHTRRVQELQKTEALMRAQAPDFGAGEETEIDPELRRRLEALGYIEK